MYMRVIVLLSCILFASGCAKDTQPKPYVVEDIPNASDYPWVEKSYQKASQKPLGTAQDIEGIKRAVLSLHPEMDIRNIQWASATEVIAYTERGKNLNLGYESFYCVINKKNGKWHVISYYMDEIS